jgi:hypothetical protein
VTISSPTEDKEEEEGCEDTSIQDSGYRLSARCSARYGSIMAFVVRCVRLNAGRGHCIDCEALFYYIPSERDRGMADVLDA